MAFVNRQGEERREERGSSGELFDFDPADPTIVKVHYDLSGWSWEQRADLSEALASADLPHVWDRQELVVPELIENQVDAIFDRLESELGPFPVALEEGAPATAFGLDEWGPADRQLLTESLIEAEVPFRWEGTTILVARDAEDTVDDLLDAIEAGEVLVADEPSSTEPPEGALSTIFLSADRLARDPLDGRARTELLDLEPLLLPKSPPYAFAPRTWTRVVREVSSLCERIREESAGPSTDDGPDVQELAGELRETIRPYV